MLPLSAGTQTYEPKREPMNNYIEILEKLDHKKTNITYSKDRTIGIQESIDLILKLTNLKKCEQCKKYFKRLEVHRGLKH